MNEIRAGLNARPHASPFALQRFGQFATGRIRRGGHDRCGAGNAGGLRNAGRIRLS